MIDGWSWFRERADAELGQAPDPPDDRLGDVVGRAAAAHRRRLAELSAAASMVIVSLALIGATVALGRANRTQDAPSLPAPAEPTASVLDSSPSPGLSPFHTRPTTGRPTVVIPARPVGSARRTGLGIAPVPASTRRASAPAPAATTPPITPRPSATRSAPAPSPTPSPTTSPPTSTPTTP